jgi:hypothetical protein
VPLGLGFPESARDDISRTARLIQDGSGGLTLVAVRDEENLDGVKVVRIEVKGPGGNRVMWVDPESGAIPVRVHDEMPGGGTYDLRYGDIRMVAGRGWLPYERTEYLPGGRVFRTVVTKIDLGVVPDDTFRMEFPKPIGLVDIEKGLSYRPQKVWELSRLPTANSVGATPLATTLGVPDPMMPGESESHTFLFTFIAVGVSVAVGAVAFLWRRATRPALR